LQNANGKIRTYISESIKKERRLEMGSKGRKNVKKPKKPKEKKK